MSNDPGRSQIDERGKQSKDKIHGHRNLLRKNLHDATDSPISGQSDARLHTSKTVIDTKSRHDGESQHVNTQAKEVDPSKLEQAHTKRQDHPNISSSTSEEHESEGSVNPQPFNIESISGKGQHSTGDHPQTVQPKPTRPTPRTNPYFPPGAAPPRYHYEHPSTTATTITSHRGSTTTSDKSDADHARVATPSAANPQPEVVPDKVDEQKAPPTNAGVPTKIPSDPDQRESPQTQLNSETTKTDVPTSQDGLAAGVFGGIANALGMRPLTSREAQLQKDNHKLKEHNKHLRTENYEVEMAARKYYQEACRLHHENERIKETLEAMTLEVKGITRRYEEAKSLSDTRGKELLGAQTFLTKADGLSISELIHKVDGLNDEIYQVSASLSETIVQKNIELSEQISVSPEDSSTAKALLGSLLCKVLRSRARRPDEGIHPLLVQITLQAFFSMFCVARIRSWNSDINFDLALQGLYEKIRSSSDQAVSGRWRALTRAQMKPDTSNWFEELTSDLNAILALASWEISAPEAKNTLENRLRTVFKVVLDVREAIGEKFTSAHVEVDCIEPNSLFNDTYMDEAYEADSKGPEKGPEIVIATVGIGLRKIVPHNASYEYGLAPKVVLESSLKAALEPPPSSSKTSKRRAAE